jgi:hypothetical protein
VNPTKGLARVISAAQIGGVRLVEASAKNRVRSVQEVGDDAGLLLNYKAHLKEGPDAAGVFFVVARMNARVAEGAKADPYVSVSVAFELTYRLPEPEVQQASRADLQAFAEVNGVFNAWPYFREFVQAATSRMNLPPIVLPLYRAPKSVKESRERKRALPSPPQKAEKE